MHRSDLGWRSAVALAALLAALLGAAQVVVGGLTAAAVLLSAERLSRLRGRGALDALLTAVGGLVVAFVLVGLVLGATPIGLSTATWGAGLSVASLLGLAAAALLPRPARTSLTPGAVRTGARVLPWIAASAVVVALAVSISARSIGPSQTPPIQMSFGKIHGTTVQVVVNSSSRTSPLELRTTAPGTELSYPLFRVPAHGSVTTMISLPATGRYQITLNYPDQTQPLRTLILDR